MSAANTTSRRRFFHIGRYGNLHGLTIRLFGWELQILLFSPYGD